MGHVANEEQRERYCVAHKHTTFTFRFGHSQPGERRSERREQFEESTYLHLLAQGKAAGVMPSEWERKRCWKMWRFVLNENYDGPNTPAMWCVVFSLFRLSINSILKMRKYKRWSIQPSIVSTVFTNSKTSRRTTRKWSDMCYSVISTFPHWTDSCRDTDSNIK